MNFQYQVANTLTKPPLELAKTAARRDLEDWANKINGPQIKDRGNVKTPSSLLKILLDWTEASYNNWEKGSGRLTRWL
ncbi:hypothetical protein OAJ77_10230 [Rhodospirillales bacterium]|nr:hypothetical protein [Rhodospirillales bacterium]